MRLFLVLFLLVTLVHCSSSPDPSASSELSNTSDPSSTSGPWIEIESISANESLNSIDFKLVLSNATDRTVSVDFNTIDGTATAGEDYTETTGNVFFDPGDTEKGINVPLLDDGLTENLETFQVNFSNPDNAALANPESTGTIIDNDTLPNFVVFLTDDQRWDTLWAMPILQQKLISRGVDFSNAFITTPLCCPARGNILSGGYYAHNTGVLSATGSNGGVKLFADGDTLATQLQQTGYQTLFVGKYLNGYFKLHPYIPPGWTHWVANNAGPTKGYADYDVTIGSSDQNSSTGQTVGPIQQYVTDYQRDQTLDFLDTVGSAPFMVFFAAFAPHAPATPGPGDEFLFDDFTHRDRAYNETDLSDKPDWVSTVKYPTVKANHSDNNDEFIRQQLRSLQAVDRAVGQIVDKIEAQGKLDNTVFIFTSDNGYLWGEHGLYRKGQPYDESLHVPFVVVAPGIKPRKDDHLVAADLDLGATLFDFAGISKNTDGKSLVPVLNDPNTAGRNEILFQHWGSHDGPFGTWAALRTKQWKYINHPTGEQELYDLENDPYEERSRHADPAVAEVLKDFSESLKQQRGLAISDFSAPKGQLNQEYSFPIRAVGGKSPYQWRIHKGTLPAGLSLNTSTGKISGIPNQSGSSTVEIIIEDSSIASQVGRHQRFIEEYTIEIAP